jgi:cytoskeleton protein RodZ
MTDDFDKKQESADLDFHTDMPVGEILRRTRVHYGQSLQQIESILRIRASQLEALEQGDVAKLPGRVYAIGFVRSYSEYLGLDGDKMVHLFKEQSVGRKAKPDLSFPVPASESKVPNLAIIAGSLFGFVVLVGFVAFLMFPREEKNNIPAVPEKLTTSQLNEAPPLVTTENAAPQGEVDANASTALEAAEPPKPANRIVIEVTEASWVQIVDAKGSAIVRQVLKAGDIYLVPDERGLVLETGNAGGLKIIVDGKPLPSLGASGQIRRKISLDPDRLLATP